MADINDGWLDGENSSAAPLHRHDWRIHSATTSTLPGEFYARESALVVCSKCGNVERRFVLLRDDDA